MNLLLVDDEVVSVQGMLEGVRWERCGIQRVFPAYTVRSARELLLEKHIDLALLDIEMPEENGMDLLRWIRSQEAVKDIPCAFLTCHAEFDYARDALQLGCVDYLLKPLEYTHVEELVLKMVSSQQALDRKRQMERYAEHLKRWYLEEKALEVDGPLEGFRLAAATDLGSRRMMGRVFQRKGETLVAVILARRQEDPNGRVWYDQLQDVTDRLENGWLKMDIPQGHWVVFTYTKLMEAVQKASDHISFLEKESCRILLDTVYEPHWERYKEDFGKTFAGFFSDEPGFYNLGGTGFGMVKIGDQMPLPWSDQVWRLFQQRMGGPTAIVGLYNDLNGAQAKARVTYMDIITRMYEENFSRQLGDWCEEHGVEYIGHVLEDVGLHSRLGPGTGHYFRAMAGQHMGGH